MHRRRVVGLHSSTVVGYIPTDAPRLAGWRESSRVTDFFDYVLVWNTGVSYGLLDGLPVWALGLIAVVAILALVASGGRRTTDVLVRYRPDAGHWWRRLQCASIACFYGAVADFFHFHWQDWSFYIFNIADVAITLGCCCFSSISSGSGRRKKS